MKATWSQYAALPLRLVLGALFVVWGLRKLIDLGGSGELMASVGFTPGAFWAALVGAIEIVGGAALLAGALTRWAALVLGFERLVALLLASGLASGTGTPAAAGGTLSLVVIAALVSLAMMGPQALALDTHVPALGALSGTAAPSAGSEAGYHGAKA